MKICSSCKVQKSFTDFQKRGASKDGFTAACKECLIARDKSRYLKEREYRLERGRIYSSTEVGKASHKASVKKWQIDNANRRAANIILNNAVKNKKIVPWPVCAIEDCNCKKVEGHHADYYRPLDVIWLCSKHHKQAHKNKS